MTPGRVSTEVRSAEAGELDALARLWNDAWQDAHARLVPEELVRVRTLENFRERMRGFLPGVRVVGPPGEPVGFHVVKGDELDQLFVAAPVRGTGVAAVLIADAEAQLAREGVKTAWLACVVGNERAARFYEKCGWKRVKTVMDPAAVPEGVIPVESWRYEKMLGGG